MYIPPFFIFHKKNEHELACSLSLSLLSLVNFRAHFLLGPEDLMLQIYSHWTLKNLLPHAIKSWLIFGGDWLTDWDLHWSVNLEHVILEAYIWLLISLLSLSLILFNLLKNPLQFDLGTYHSTTNLTWSNILMMYPIQRLQKFNIFNIICWIVSWFKVRCLKSGNQILISEKYGNDVKILLFIFQDILLGDCIGVTDSWMPSISSQGESLLSLDISGSDVSDTGLKILRGCSKLQMLSLDNCEHISDRGIHLLSGSVYIIRNNKKSDEL